MTSGLLDAFSQGWSSDRPRGDLAALERALREAVSDAVEGSGLQHVDREGFVTHLAGRIPGDADPLEHIESLRLPDLHLAYACVSGDEEGVRLFAQRFGSLVESTLTKVRLSNVGDDVRQTLLDRLLIPRDDRPAALELYSGRGPLSAYLRVAITREAIRLTKRHQRERPDTDALLDRAVSDADPETAALKARYGPVVKTSFQKALDELSPRDRRLLRYHYVESLTTRQMAVLLSVHSSTVTRQLAQTRARLLQLARRHMAGALHTDDTEVASIVRLVESQLDLSLVRLLATRPPESG